MEPDQEWIKFQQLCGCAGTTTRFAHVDKSSAQLPPTLEKKRTAIVLRKVSVQYWSMPIIHGKAKIHAPHYTTMGSTPHPLITH